MPSTRPLAASPPVHRSILIVDIERSTCPLRTNPVKQELRRTVYQLLDQALENAGIGPRHCEYTDRGDGAMVLVPPLDRIPKTLLLHPFVPELNALLSAYNAAIPAEERAVREIRVRLVVHAGEVHTDGNGPFGEDVDVACRLIDAPGFKQALRGSDGPLGVLVSEHIYWAIVRHRYDGIHAEAFARTVRVSCAGRRRRGWMHLPPAVALAPVTPLRAGAA